jgi:hypothetical protein
MSDVDETARNAEVRCGYVATSAFTLVVCFRFISVLPARTLGGAVPCLEIGLSRLLVSRMLSDASGNTPNDHTTALRIPSALPANGCVTGIQVTPGGLYLIWVSHMHCCRVRALSLSRSLALSLSRSLALSR